MQNCLIFSSNKDNWPKNYKHIYQGYWCLENIENSFSSLNKYRVVESVEHDEDKVDNTIYQIASVYNSIIDDLVRELNKKHNENKSKRYWEIIIGPWLKSFLGIVHNRYYRVSEAIKFNEISCFVYESKDNFVISENDICCNSHDKIAFEEWNLALYEKIVDFLKTTETIIKINTKRKFKSKKKNLNLYLKKNLNLYLKFKETLSLFLSLFLKKKSIVLYKLPLKKIDIILTQLKFFQVPQFFISRNIPFVKSDEYLRKQFNFKKLDVSKFERFVRQILPLFLPTNYLENYNNIKNISKKKPLPENPSIIFCCTSFFDDEIFKFWTADKVEKKIKYCVIQHGCGYFTSKNTSIQTDLDTSDKFLSWGDYKKERIIPFFNTNNLRHKKKNDFNSKSKIFFYAPAMYSDQRKRPYNDYMFMMDDHYRMKNIIYNLKSGLNENLIIKLYNYDDFFLRKKILKEILNLNNSIKITDNINKDKIYKHSKLIVHANDGTGFLETLSLNIPSIFSIPNLNWVTRESKKDYEELVDANILFFDPIKAAIHINNHYDNIENWWENSKVKKIKNNFVNKYSRPLEKDYLSHFQSIIKDTVN